MSGFAETEPAGRRGPFPPEFADWRWSGRRRPPLPLMIVAVAAAFWLFHPLGVALLVYVLWRTMRGRHACGPRHEAFRHGGPWARRGGPSSRNSAFEAHRRETLKELDEQAEAFDAFERERRLARDREAFERFRSERPAKGDDAAK